MIKTKEDLKVYLQADRAAQPSAQKKFWKKILLDRIYRLKTLMRRCEYHYNNKANNIFHSLLYYFYDLRYKHLLRSFGSEIPLNVFGKGLIIWHPEGIIINPQSKIGDNCSISARVVIAHAHDRCPTIGNNVEIMINATILDGIIIPDYCRIGANALVIKSIYEPNTTWAGVPAKKISNKGVLDRRRVA